MKNIKKLAINFISIFLFSWFLIIAILIFFSSLSWNEIRESFGTLFQQLISSWQYWLFLFLLYIFHQLIINLINTYKKFGFIKLLKRGFSLIMIPILTLFVLFKISQHYVNSENYYQWDKSVENLTGEISNHFIKDGKHRGIHIFGNINKETLKPLIKNNIEWITIVPYIGQSNHKGEIDGLGLKKGGKKDSVLENKIVTAHNSGFKVFLKPHIWLSSKDGE